MERAQKKNKGKKTLAKRSTTGHFISPLDKDSKEPRPTEKGQTITQGSYKSHIDVRNLEEPVASYTSRIRAIGNSKGVILNNQLLKAAGLKADADIVIMAVDGVIYIVQPQIPGVNSDLTTWDMQFKDAIKNGSRPEKDLFEGMNNEFDSHEW